MIQFWKVQNKLNQFVGIKLARCHLAYHKRYLLFRMKRTCSRIRLFACGTYIFKWTKRKEIILMLFSNLKSKIKTIHKDLLPISESTHHGKQISKEDHENSSIFEMFLCAFNLLLFVKFTVVGSYAIQTFKIKWKKQQKSYIYDFNYEHIFQKEKRCWKYNKTQLR